VTLGHQAARVPDVYPTGPPREAYLDAAQFADDLRWVFAPRWHYVAHAGQLQGPGSFVTRALGFDEVVVMRTGIGELRAFANVCPHRGHRLITSADGVLTRRSIICPYHGWAFSRDDGTCLAATRMPQDFDRSPYSVSTVWLEEYCGLVFVCVAEESPTPIHEEMRRLGQLGPDGEGLLAGFDVGRMKVAASISYDIEANWKVVVENDDECYHCALNHPELVANYDPWGGMTVVGDDAGQDDLWTAHDWAVVHVGARQSPDQLCALPSPRGRRSGGAPDSDISVTWQPSGHIVLLQDHAWLWNIFPLSAGRTRLHQEWLVHEDAHEGRDFSVPKLTWLFSTTMEQDKELCEQVQRGISNPRYRPGPLNPSHQAPAATFYSWYARSLTKGRDDCPVQH